ncbi:NAD(P)-dependent oxidoreductase [Shewanella baltica]|uniref:NAD-dependent epimerase/dehydratase family protein n=1 Tax=Shewanella baltica TaxID=62322 RepID=UPI00217E3957|nr:NAD(P)-dependent oxidoreductase [Shewanella baltica]MCS6136730.1 NAD(P)-dependent oxidoreductase [Shewanella baltica]
MRILITGVTGFVGSHLATYLSDKGHLIYGLIRKPIQDKSLLSKLNKVSLCLFHEDSLVDLVSEIKPDIVIHLASLYLTVHSYEQIDDLIKSNITFPTKLLEAMSVNNVTKLINTGTSWQHFNSASYEPVNLYAATKQAFDDVIKYYTSAKYFSCITLKLFDTYGPDDKRGKLISLLDKLSKTKEGLSMSAGEQIVELTHIDDVCAAYLAAIELIDEKDADSNDCYGVSSNEKYNLRTLVEIYEKANNVNLDIKWGGRPYREREVMDLCNNLPNIPKWEAKISLSEGLKISNRV